MGIRWLVVIAALFACVGCKPAQVAQLPVRVEPAATSSDEVSPQPETPAPADMPDEETPDPPSPTDSEEPETPPSDPDEVEIISFDDLIIGMPVDAKFRRVMLSYNDGRVLDLEGKRVNVGGYMNATDRLKGVKEFILLRNLECKFGPGGQADHLVHVILQDGLTTDFTDKVVYVEGVLRIKEFPLDGPSTWSIYDVEATKVSTRPPRRNR